MKQTAKKFIKHPLIYGSSIVVIGGVVANSFNFLFNLFMSNNLSVADYGTLATIVSIIMFPGLIVGAIVPLVVRFAGEYFAKGQLGLIRELYIKIFRFIFSIGLVLFLLFLIMIPQIENFFHIKNTLILVLTDFIIFLAFVHVTNNAMLQAKLAFGFQVFLSVVGALGKLLLGILFVYQGLAINGAVLAILLSAIALYVISFFPLKFIFDKNLASLINVDRKELFAYGIPSALTLLGLTSFISIDILLVKHFFTPIEAGIYAGLALMGKVVFYVSSPIPTVMFPLIVQKHSRNEAYINTLKLAVLLVMAVSLAVTAFYFIFPNFSIHIFFPKHAEYLREARLLGFFGLFIAGYSLVYVLSNFYLSIKRIKIYIPVLIGAFMQASLIWFFHESFLQILVISFGVTFSLAFLLLLYYPRAVRNSS